MITVIIPHFCAEETVAMCSEYMSDIILASERINTLLGSIGNVKFTSEHQAFVSRLRSTVLTDVVCDVDAMTNVEIAEAMVSLAYAYSDLYGCDIDIEFNGLCEFDLLRKFSFEMYIFALSVFCVVARNYSANRNVKTTVHFRVTGIYVDFRFNLAEAYAEYELKSHSSELVKFQNKAFAYRTDCEMSQSDGVVNLRVYPFVYKSEYSDVKERKKKLPLK